MRNIIQKLLEIQNTKERTKLLEQFRNFQFSSERKECKETLFEVFKEAKSILENSQDNNEKRTAMRVLGSIFLIYPTDPIMIEVLNLNKKETLVKETDILEILDIILKLIENEDGNLRLSAAYLIDHLKCYISSYNQVDLFFNLLSLKNSQKNKENRTIGFCLDKILNIYLEGILESSYPSEVKKMKINVHSKDKKTIEMAEKIEKLANQMVSETEKDIKKVLAMRGESLFESNFIPYIENIGFFQIFYEMQKLKEMHKEKKISEEIMHNYLLTRTQLCVNNRIKMLDDLPEKEEFSLVLIDLNKNKLFVMDLDKMYNFLLKTQSFISNIQNN